MFANVKIGRFPIRTVWLIFLGINIFLVSVMIGTLSTPRWVKSNISKSQNPNLLGYSEFNASIFQGSISECTNGCDYTYSGGSTTWCNDYNYYSDLICVLDPVCMELKTMCDTFSRLSGGGGLFILLEICSIIGIITWSVMMFTSIYWVIGCYCFNYCCSICACVFHWVAIILWLGVVGSQSNNCDTFPSDGTHIIFCNTDGPALGIFILVIFPFIVVPFVSFACVAYNKRFGGNNLNNFQQSPQVAIVYQGNAQINFPYGPSAAMNQGLPQYNPAVPNYNNAPQYNPGVPQYVPGTSQYNNSVPPYAPQVNPWIAPYNHADHLYVAANPNYYNGPSPNNPQHDNTASIPKI